MNGPTIPISVQGCGVEPKLVFSPAEIDFGMCFIHQPEMSPREAKVVMANHDKEDIRLDHLSHRLHVCVCVVNMYVCAIVSASLWNISL